jgi:hypothetical protein
VDLQNIVYGELDIGPEKAMDLMRVERLRQPGGLGLIRLVISLVRRPDKGDHVNDGNGHALIPWREQPTPSVYGLDGWAGLEREKASTSGRASDITRADLDEPLITRQVVRWI